MFKRVCPVCGIEFLTAFKNKKYCSIICQKRFHKPEPTKKVCIQCGKEFIGNARRCKRCTSMHSRHHLGEYAELFTPTTDLTIVEWAEIRGMSARSIANELHRNLDAVKNRIKELQESGRYGRLKEFVMKRRRAYGQRI